MSNPHEGQPQPQQGWPRQPPLPQQGWPQQAGPQMPSFQPPSLQPQPQHGVYPAEPVLTQTAAQPPMPHGGKRPKHKAIVALSVAVAVVLIAIVLLIAYLMPEDLFGSGSESTEQKTARLYTKVLDEIDSYEFVSEEMLSGDSDYKFSGYRYTLTEMTGDDIPELIVQTDSPTLATVRVFSADVTANKVIAPAETLQIGVASAGGFRGSISGTKDGKSLQYTAYNSGTGKVVTETVTMSDGELKHAKVAEYRINQEPAEIKSTREDLDFIPISDRSLLEKLTQGKPAEAGKAEQHEQQEPAQPSEEELKQQAIDDAKAAGREVFTGTVRVVDVDYLMEWQKLEGSAEMYCGAFCADEQYAILVFDSAQAVEANRGGDPGKKTLDTTGLSLAYNHEPEKLEAWRAYDGQVVTVSLAGDKLWWQSDGSLPMMLPRAYDADVQVIWPKGK